MSAPPGVRSACEDEAPRVAEILSAAFVDEAGLNYWLRQGRDKDRARRVFFDAAVRDVVHPARRLWLAEDDGVELGAAIWLEPGDKAFDFTPWQEITLTPLLYRIAGFSGMNKGMALGKKLAEFHPTRPHAHLVFLGVAPEAQGRGVGSAILKHTLAPLDRDGVLAYLEATTERNIALYERHGFVVTGEFELPGLHMRTMTREPRA
jgi:ribosomal protein S18 acetylase RimI-like enzyme